MCEGNWAGHRLQVTSFKTAFEFRRWLAKNHAGSDGVWLRLLKKSAGKSAKTPAMTYAEALDQALCYGWIDGQKKTYDGTSWLQRFTPRRPNSRWSETNTRHAERLIKTKLMEPPGLKAVEDAKADGRWASAYVPQSLATAPADFLDELNKNRKARAFFETLNRANVYAIVYRLQTAKKPETRAKRMKLILAMMAQGKKFHA